MDVTTKAAHTIKGSPLPPAPDASELLTDAQWDSLLALADTIIPGIVPSSSSASSKTNQKISDAEYEAAKKKLQFDSTSDESAEHATQLLTECASSIPEFKDSFVRMLAYYIPPANVRALTMILSALNNRALSLMLTGSSTPIQNQPYAVREAILNSWQKSYIPAIRGLHRSLVALTAKSYVSLSPTLPKVLGMPRVPIHGAPAEGFDYSFLQFPPGETTETVETDIVIVGSGCGAGVAAKNLSEAGHKVIVVEKSYHYPASHFPMEHKEGSVNMFAGGGVELTDDGSMGILSGSTWGGGGTVNWSAALQTQGFVRQEWADAGLPFFTSAAFQNSLDRVCEYMGVHTEHIEHNHGNKMILEGARKLGYAAKAVPQNTGNKKHYCGYCALGCASSEKQGPAVSFLKDAANAGATFIEGFRAEKVLFEEGKNASGEKVATGVTGTWTQRADNSATPAPNPIKRSVTIKAKKVIVACGSLESPLLLLRSGIKNRHIGRNLHLHPVVITSASFDYDVNPWEGGILTSVVSSFENLDGAGHGSKVEALAMLPGFFLPLFPWNSGLEYKTFAANLRRTNGFISLTRDKHTGRVYPDPIDGRARIDYVPSTFDRQHILEGVIAAAKIAYISGAREIRTTARNIAPFVRTGPVTPSDEGINDPAFSAWLASLRKGVPLPPETTAFASAHQMGSCRMGKNARSSVVDSECRVWGTEGLHVMDASVFPSASGVNPMITNMGIADWVSRELGERMKRAAGSRL